MLRCESKAIVGRLGRIRELYVFPQDEILLSGGSTQPRIGWKKGQERPWAHIVLIQCATRLNGLAYINMREVDLSPSIRSGRHYRSLTRLDLRLCKFAGILQLHRFVTSFPTLSDLTLSHVYFHSRIIPLDIPKGGHPLVRLRLSGGHGAMTAVSQRLSRVHLVRYLEYLYWWPFHMEQAEDEWTTLIEAIDGTSLQELRCDVPSSWQGQWAFSLFQASFADDI